MFCRHFAALQKQLSFQDSAHVKRGGEHKYSRKVRTIREFLNAVDEAEPTGQLMNQTVLRVHDKVVEIFEDLHIDDQQITKPVLMKVMHRFGFVLTESELEMLCNIFMLYNESQDDSDDDSDDASVASDAGGGAGGAAGTHRIESSSSSSAVAAAGGESAADSRIHADEFMLIFPAALKVHRSTRNLDVTTELQDQVAQLQQNVTALQNQVLSMSQMVGTFMGETSLASFQYSLNQIFNSGGGSGASAYPAWWWRWWWEERGRKGRRWRWRKGEGRREGEARE
jgi:hypothetical protein